LISSIIRTEHFEDVKITFAPILRIGRHVGRHACVAIAVGVAGGCIHEHYICAVAPFVAASAPFGADKKVLARRVLVIGLHVAGAIVGAEVCHPACLIGDVCRIAWPRNYGTDQALQRGDLDVPLNVGAAESFVVWI